MVNILMATFRRPRLLLRALRSLQMQTYSDWVALVCDDGEGEGIEAAHSLNDPRIQAFANQGKGQVDARNTALQHTTGDVVALLDDDDWWEDPSHLHLVLRALRPGPALVYRTGWLVTERDGLELSRQAFEQTATQQSLRENNTLLASSVAYPKTFHDEFGLFDHQIADYWDWDWWLRVTAKYPLVRVPGPGVAISMHGGNVSYGVRREERQAALNRLCVKHGLVGIELKDHRAFVEPG